MTTLQQRGTIVFSEQGGGVSVGFLECMVSTVTTQLSILRKKKVYVYYHNHNVTILKSTRTVTPSLDQR